MKRLSVLLFSYVLLLSCNKEVAETTCLDGYIFWGGDPAADGRGWYFSENKSSTTTYYLESLPDKYKTDETAVSICLLKTDKQFLCFCAGDFPYYYRITKIDKR
ncbi:MAG TPA: hypothetical protein VM888_05025 [Chitinophagaceae bacterium]|jgi:hypothetical protein|nr:hypothetical protein [Chitinophagaceae bacterium]